MWGDDEKGSLLAEKTNIAIDEILANPTSIKHKQTFRCSWFVFSVFFSGLLTGVGCIILWQYLGDKESKLLQLKRSGNLSAVPAFS